MSLSATEQESIDRVACALYLDRTSGRDRSVDRPLLFEFSFSYLGTQDSLPTC